MRIAVLGAAGAMARVVVRDLLAFAPEISVTAADRRAVDFGDPRVRFAPFDASDEAGTARLLSGHDAALNCVTYYRNVEVMRAALRARVPYADLGGLYHGSLKQFALHDEFAAAGVPAMLGIGSTPGITNVMAGKMAAELDAVDEIHVRVGCRDESSAGPLPVPYAFETVLDEFALEPMVFRDGRIAAVPPMSGEETVEFPSPVGKMTAFFTLHSELAMFPRSFPGLRAATFKVAFEPEFTRKVRFLVELGLASREKLVGDVSPRQVLLELAARQPPAEGEPRDCDVLRVEVSGRKSGSRWRRRAELVVRPHPEWRVPAGALDTGVPLSIVGQMLASGEISNGGVLCPETSVPAAPFFRELERRGMRVNFEAQEESPR